MEEDCVSALYASLGLSAGAELSSDDVSLLFCKVFHVSSNSDEAHEAMKKIARGDNSWSCSGQNVLDVLFKIKMEREKKEMVKSYWDFQLLNCGNLNYITDHQSKDAGTFSSLTRGLVGRKERCNRVMNVKRLKKAAGQSWARLASEGVNSILPFPWQGQRLGPRGQAWGSISLSDVLLLVEVKYDAVMLLLYREMLQKHHIKGVWEMLPPLQRHQEVEVLGELVQDALESADTLDLALLPGALRIYKTCSRSHSGIDPESVEQSWSAVTFLNELKTFRQQEQKTLTALGQRLCGESLRLLCLYISLATHRAQREKTSQGALLAARQSWDAWPQVASPCRAEQVTLWLHDREEEEEKENFKILQQKTELQLLVLTQEQERRHLIMLLHQISVENLQESDTKQASLKAGCIRRLRQIHQQLQTQSGAQTPSETTTFQNKTREKSTQILEDCAMFLVTYLTELQEVQAFHLLQALQGQNAWDVQALRDKYEAETETQQFTNLLHLLMSDDPLTSGSKVTENASTDQTGPVSSHNEEIAGESVAAPVRSEPKEVHSANVSGKQEVCAGCGVVMEELPYLEISCAPEAPGDAPEGLSAADEEEQNGVTNGHENYEKQRSLITLAWSKPPEEDMGYEEKVADEDAKLRQDGQSSMKTQLLSTQCEKTVLERNEDEQNQKKEPDQPEERDVGSVPQTEKLQVFSPHISGNSHESTDDFCSETSDIRASATREVSEVETCPSESKQWDLRGLQHSDHHEDLTSSQESTKEGSFSEGNTRESTPMERGRATHPVSAVERERTMRNLVDMQRRFEEKHQRDKERQFLRVQERLAIIQNRKAEEDLLGLKNTDRLIHLTQDLPMEDKNQQKTVVKERLEQLRRERSYIMQSKRNRNTMGFKELLAPVQLHSSETEDGTN